MVGGRVYTKTGGGDYFRQPTPTRRVGAETGVGDWHGKRRDVRSHHEKHLAAHGRAGGAEHRGVAQRGGFDVK